MCPEKGSRAVKGLEHKSDGEQLRDLGLFRLDIRKKLFSEKSGAAVAHAAQGGGGVIVPGGVQEAFRCCTEGHGLVGNIGGR